MQLLGQHYACSEHAINQAWMPTRTLSMDIMMVVPVVRGFAAQSSDIFCGAVIFVVFGTGEGC